MVFSSLIFLCIFMPIVFTAYYLCPSKFRNLLLLFASLVFYAWGEPIYILIMIFSTIFNYIMGILVSILKDSLQLKKAKIILIITIIGDLSILFFFKYTNFFIVLPIGISFYTFQTMSYVVDVYKGSVKVEKNIINFAMYVCMFPQLIAGPIVRYGQIAEEIHSRKLSDKNIALGFYRFIIGLGKKVIFANQIGALWDEIYNCINSNQNISLLLAWLGAIAFTFQIYFDFSGYSDMAIGMGQMLGFNFPENFNYPYLSQSITEFWRRWHISLGTWFKEYVYIPLGGSKKGLFIQIINLFIVWTLTGLWHGAALNFVMWGIYFFVLLLIEKCFLLKILKKIPKILRHIYALFFIIIGWVIFACEDFETLGNYLKVMAGVGVPVFNNYSIYKLYTNLILLLLMAAASIKLPHYIVLKIKSLLINKDKLYFCITAIFSLTILALSISLLVSGTYNPFLYFRF